jgi:hypothetical protein
MQDTAKYLVHADITTDGVVERSDVVGAVFGQTEGLLGDELDLRELQDSAKVGRIDVEIDSENGQSFGHVTIATSLDQVETAILAAALETIDRVGPARSTIEVRRIEDLRAARRREVVERAKSILAEAFDDSMRSSRDLIEEVREAVRVEDIVEYEGLPAGPNVPDSDAIVIVEGRADVLALLRYGIKNAVAVEGTDVPDAVAELTQIRAVTAFLDGDRGGELILKELAQIGSIEYVAFAPEGHSVEDLARREVMAALREKVPYDSVVDVESPSEVAAPDGPPSTVAVKSTGAGRSDAGGDTPGTAAADDATAADVTDDTVESAGAVDDTPGIAGPVDAAPSDAPASLDPTDGEDAAETEEEPASGDGAAVEAGGTADGAAVEAAADRETLPGHVRVVIRGDSGRVRLLDDAFRTAVEGDAEAAFDLVAEADEPPAAVVLDGPLDQRLLDVAAQRGVGQVVADSTGEFVKQPTSVRVRTGEELLAADEA